MRLIDAENLKEFLCALMEAGAEYNGIIELLDKQPTVYDINKVCMSLNEAKDMDNLIDCDHAIKIVKTGGIK